MALAAPSEPLKLADGRLVYPNGTIVDPNEPKEEMVEIPTNQEATKLVVAARRKMSDLPDVPKTMNTVSVVLAYSLFGLSEIEIALATGLSEEQIGRVMMHDAYARMKEDIISSVLAAETDNVRDLFQQHSRKAVNKLLHVLDNSKVEANKIAVARDILDRAGHRPTDVVEHRHKMEGGLTIEIIKKDEKNSAPTIELELEN